MIVKVHFIPQLAGQFIPQLAHPGQILKEDFLNELGLSQPELASALGTTFRTINEIVNEKRNISTEMAIKLSKFFGTSIELWLNLQNQYDIFRITNKERIRLGKYDLSEENSIFYNLQDSSLRRRLEKDTSIFTRELTALPKFIINVFVDEIQKVPSLLEEVQFLYDIDKTRFQFYLTGSSARKLKGHRVVF